VQAAPPVTTQPVVVHAKDTQFRDYPVTITDSKGQQVRLYTAITAGLRQYVAQHKYNITCSVSI